MPLSHCLSAALDVMASSECGEAASGVSGRVLEENVVLGFGAEMLHRGMERGTREAAGLGARIPGTEKFRTSHSNTRFSQKEKGLKQNQTMFEEYG
jgi:hypothetical protein